MFGTGKSKDQLYEEFQNAKLLSKYIDEEITPKILEKIKDMNSSGPEVTYALCLMIIKVAEEYTKKIKDDDRRMAEKQGLVLTTAEMLKRRSGMDLLADLFGDILK